MVTVIPFVYDSSKSLASNTYVFFDDKKSAFVVDPSVDNDSIVTYLKKNKLKLKGILLTHGHYDHIKGVDILVKKYKAPVYIGFDDEELLTDPYLNCSISKFGVGDKVVIYSKAQTVADNDVIEGLNEDIVTIYTPYHTKGGVCYYLKDSKILFSGDSLFRMWLGREDLPSSCPKERPTSIAKLMKLEDYVKVYPGHGRETDIGSERKHINI